MMLAPTTDLPKEHAASLTWIDLVLFFLAGLAVASVTAAFQSSAGYMDAQYYYSMGRELASGKGWWEPYLWNYLDNPTGLPHPAFVYWMPLAALIASASMTITGGLAFNHAQAASVFLAAFVPVITALISFQLSGKKSVASLSGWLAVFPGLSLPMLTTTDTFSPVMLLGGLWFLAVWKFKRITPGLAAALLGLLSGLMHAARADGLMWLGISGLVVMLYSWQEGKPRFHTTAMLAIRLGIFVAIGYFLIMGSWYVRNSELYGTPFSPASGRALWIGDYNELYSYPADPLTFQHWASIPIREHLNYRWTALTWNAGNFLANNASIILLPLLLISLWQRRREASVRWFLLVFALVAFVMTVVFPLPGSRGGFLHSGAALQPVLWALAADGLWRLLQSAHHRLGWKLEQPWRVFGTALVILQVGLSAYAVLQMIGDDIRQTAWDVDDYHYRQVDAVLVELGARPDDLVLTNNPPGYFSATGRGGISVPNDSIDRTLAAGTRYGADFLVLEEDQENLSELYKQPRSLPGLTYLQTVEEIHLFRLDGLP